MIKVITKYKGKILGCGIVGWQVGELIPPWVFVLTEAMKTSYIALMIAPHSSSSKKFKRAASSYFTSSLFIKKPRKIVHFLSWLG